MNFAKRISRSRYEASKDSCERQESKLTSRGKMDLDNRRRHMTYTDSEACQVIAACIASERLEILDGRRIRCRCLSPKLAQDGIRLGLLFNEIPRTEAGQPVL